MATLEPGSEFLGMTLNSVIAAEQWGSIWRASHPQYGRVIAILYLGEGGDAVAEYPLAQRDLWNRHAMAGEPFAEIRFAGYMGFGDGREAPYLLCEDPGGATLRETLAAGRMDPKDATAMAASLAKGLGALNSDGSGPWGLAPEYILRTAAGGWKMLPVCAHPAVPLTAAARYYPADAQSAPQPLMHRPDVYALSSLWASAIAGNLDAPLAPAAVRAAVPLSRLGMMILNNMTPQRGQYTEHRLVHMAAERWIRQDAAADEAEAAEARAAAQRSPFMQKLHENRAILRRIGSATAAVAGLVLGYYLVTALFSTRNTEMTPRGVSALYFEAIVKKRVATAAGLEIGEATGAAQSILRAVEQLEREGKASALAAASSPQMRADTNPIQARTTLIGEGGEPILTVEYVISRREDGTHRISRVLFAEPSGPPPGEDEGQQ
jgi:hypothetical protein